MIVLSKDILVKDSNVITKLYRPETEIKKLVVFCHGFPGTNRLSGLAPILTEHGIGLVEVGYRGDKGCEGKFSFLETPFDILCTYQWLGRTFPDVPKILLGYSAGGFYLQVFMTRWHPRPEKIVLLNSIVCTGVLNYIGEQLWNEARQVLSLNDQDFYRQELVTLEEMKDMIKSIFKSIDVPVTVIHSKNDEVIPYGSARQFFHETDCVQSFRTIPDKGHLLDGDEPELVRILLD